MLVRVTLSVGLASIRCSISKSMVLRSRRRAPRARPDRRSAPSYAGRPGAGRWLAWATRSTSASTSASAGGEPLLLRDGLQEQGAPDGLLGARAAAHPRASCSPTARVRVDALAAQPLPGVLDLVGDLAHDQRLRHPELVAGQHASMTSSSSARCCPRSRRAVELARAPRPAARRASRTRPGPWRTRRRARAALLLHLGHLHAGVGRTCRAAPRSGGRRRSAPRLRALLAGAQADHRLVDLGQHAAAADQEVVAGLGRGLCPSGASV